MDEVPGDRVLLANIMARTNTYISVNSDVHLGVMAKIIQIKFIILDECLQNIQALSLLTSSIPSEMCTQVSAKVKAFVVLCQQQLS